MIKNDGCTILAYKIRGPGFQCIAQGPTEIHITSADTEKQEIAAVFHFSFVSAQQDCPGVQVFTSFPWENHLIQEDGEQGPSPHKGQVQP